MGQIPINSRQAEHGNWGQIPINSRQAEHGGSARLSVRCHEVAVSGGRSRRGRSFACLSSASEISHAGAPAMGTHFSGLSLKKWSPCRAALK